MSDMPEKELIWINSNLWIKLHKVIEGYDFDINELVEWILSNVDLYEYAKKLYRKVESEVDEEEEAEKEDEQEAEEEETDTNEEQAESADDEEENFGKY